MSEDFDKVFRELAEQMDQAANGAIRDEVGKGLALAAGLYRQIADSAAGLYSHARTGLPEDLAGHLVVAFIDNATSGGTE
ncbi:hypothetical protein ACFZCK_14010 [Kitasatospora purpeofusca]|uniref:hypothetical protein n=1 Tax=Kitasatospora purpeofusca TaxID=67352 RepID=UPI0036EC1923